MQETMDNRFKRQPLQIAPSPQDPQLLRSRGPEGELRNRPTSAPEVVMAIFTPFTGLTGAHEPY